jgi:hypothetical protein
MDDGPVGTQEPVLDVKLAMRRSTLGDCLFIGITGCPFFSGSIRLNRPRHA